MGLIKEIQCNQCGKKWERHEGSGYKIAYYHCNNCGKEYIYEIFDSCTELWEQYYYYLEKLEIELKETEKLLLEKQLNSLNRRIKKHRKKNTSTCNCGGNFEFDSETIICPDCHSNEVTDKGYCALWD